MSSGAYVGRVGRLAVALGIGAALVTGCPGIAWAEEPGQGPPAAEDTKGGTSTTTKTPDTTTPAEHEVKSGDDGAGTTVPTPTTSTTTTTTSTGSTITQAPPGVAVSTGGAQSGATPTPTPTPTATATTTGDPDPTKTPSPTASIPTNEPLVQPDTGRSAHTVEAEEKTPPAPLSKVAATVVDVDPPQGPTPSARISTNSFVAQSLSSTPQLQTMAVTAAATPPVVPSLRLWPTAFDPLTVVTYVTGLVTDFVGALLSPFTAGLPPLPVDLTPWGLLAWVRRELFNSSPVFAYNPLQNSQSLVGGDVLVKGNVGASDPDGDPLTYTVIGRPLNGGTVEVDENGNFTYRPMNAMAAVGGTDQFTVVVSDESAGLHVHGPLGLLKFVPIVGNFINAGGGDSVAQTITVNVTPVAGVDLSFPTDFHWGVAHAGFQAEGGPGSPVDPNSDWYRWVHDPFNQFLGITHGVPENGPGTYVMYDEDAQLAEQDLGMNTFRMSIEWSRIFPNSTASVDISDEGGGVSEADLEALDLLANQAEVDHYRDVFDSLRLHNLEPLITINHFTLPAWVHDPTTTRLLAQFGLPAPAAGWLSPTTPVEFEKYAAYVAWKYGDQVDNWTVLNEPVPPVLTEFLAIPGLVPGWPPGLIRPDLASTFLVNQAKGYVAAYDEIHAWDQEVATSGQPAAFVGFANNMLPARPANPVNPLDVQAADAWNDFYNRWFPNAVIDGWVDANLDGIQTPDEVHPEFMDKADFMGVQYYGSQPMLGFGVAPIPGFPFLKGFPVRCAATSPTCSDFNQDIDPGGFREVLEVAASYGKPLWVTENGIADAGDSKRPPYLVNHIAVVQDQIAHGADIRGYTYWSFVDNLEWANGYDLEFGLYGSDPTTPELERTPKPDSIAAISAITTSPTHSLPLDLLAQYIPGAV